MSCYRTLCAAVIMIALIPAQALALEFVTVGPRAMGMGGAGVAVTTDALATYWNPAGLAMTQTVDVRIQVSERTSALVIPRGAVSIDGDKRYVFRVENRRLQRIPVTVGISNPTKIEILSGLSEGDVVALPGNVALKQDLSVVPVQQE